MAASRLGRSCPYRSNSLISSNMTSTTSSFRLFPPPLRPTRHHRPAAQIPRRDLTCTRCLRQSQRFREKESFRSRLGKAWSSTPIKWYPIPVGLGIGFLGLLQLRKTQTREKAKEEAVYSSDGDAYERRPPKRERIRPSGPWQVQIMSTLPLKAVSRLWGRFNELEIPYYLRVPGFKLYGWIFGVNFSEIEEPDLHVYPNLASFFYRKLKPGLRPLDPNPTAVLSPADGRVLQFGLIEHGEVEQVKGMTYSLDALLGKSPPQTSPNHSLPSNIFASSKEDAAQSRPSDDPDSDTMTKDQEFAIMNGISYTLPNLFSGQNIGSADSGLGSRTPQDASTTPRPSSEAEVRADFATTAPWWSPFSPQTSPTKLYYLVVYLAPGDYHRFHSPVSWVCSLRRHFAGELYSVSPYLQRTLPGLFTLNERIVLLGRWKYGFFSYTPVGATNVGSIKINFDRELRTNSLTTDTQADRDAAAAAERGEPYSGFSEATYRAASQVLGGHALRRGEEMGGFGLGSSIVLVFEAPGGRSEQSGGGANEVRGGWKWNVEKGQNVKVGEALGWVEEE